jgi:hypothetical protein
MLVNSIQVFPKSFLKIVAVFVPVRVIVPSGAFLTVKILLSATGGTFTSGFPGVFACTLAVPTIIPAVFAILA